MKRPPLAALAAEPFDLLVIGGGINGAGIARDAAMRGLRTVLVEKSDLASGTSAWSTRLIHGGLRYLEYAEIGLVRESLRERGVLARIAPHLVRPLQLLIPLYRAGRRGRWTVRAGMIAYDLLSLDTSLGRHRMLSPAETLTFAPGLSPDGLVGAAVYFDAQAEFPERIVVENALSADAHGAVILTQTSVDRLTVESGAVRAVELRDALTGERASVRASFIINAAGPWVDRVLAGLGAPQPQRLIGGTKGSHIIVDPFPGAPDPASPTALYAEAAADGRPFFIIPWNRQLLIGTTDTRFEADPADARADDADIAYLLSETNRLFPGVNLTPDHVHFTYSGVRPLPYQPDAAPSAVTRRHILHDHAPEVSNLISILGGKLTTYRSLAAETVTTVLRRLPGAPADPGCTTAAEPLPGARDCDPETCVAELRAAGADDATIDRLRRVYGARASRILGQLSLFGRSGEPHPPANVPPLLAAELAVAFREEGARTLTDALFRRTMLGLSPTRALDLIPLAADAAAAILAWSPEETAAQADGARAFATDVLFAPSAPSPIPGPR